MHISRIQVEEGFLHGLDLRLTDGLNVLIGARGTGKTSVIELLRFALGARSHTPGAEAVSLQHARAVLGGGQVTVTLAGNGSEITVVRAGGDSAPRSTAPFEPPVVFSQTEIETVGLSDSGRLRILDEFLLPGELERPEEAAAISAIRSAHHEIVGLQNEIQRLLDGTVGLPGLRAEKAQLEGRQLALQQGSHDVQAKQEFLKNISAQLVGNQERADMLGRLAASANSWTASLTALAQKDFGVEEWRGDVDSDPLREFRIDFAQGVSAVWSAASQFNAIAMRASEASRQLEPARVHLEAAARNLRTEVDNVAEGAGSAARQLATVNSAIAQAESLARLANERLIRLSELRGQRNLRLDQLEAIRARRYDARCRAAMLINNRLGPRVRLDVMRYGDLQGYLAAIIEALKGSGMRYNELAANIASNVSPRELLIAVENEDFEQLSRTAGLPRDRAVRLIGALRESGIADIITAPLEDNVVMSLLDGTTYKDIGSLSSGQRCTVILPIALLHEGRTLVIDQPEDHIDNAFIAETVIRALRGRSGAGQTILSTHNANIPVLGGADLVVEMTSDGRRGHVEVSKPLQHPSAVAAITTVMEGGREAFEGRADFYRDHSR